MKFDREEYIRGRRVEVFRQTKTKQAAMCLGYAPEKQIYRCLEAFEGENFEGPKLLIDLGFPGNSLLKYPGWEAIRIKNQGTAGNWNLAYRMLKKPDKLIGVEPDELPSPGWTKAVLRLLDVKNVAYVTMFQKGLHERLYKADPEWIASYKCVEFKDPCGWPCGGFAGRYLEHGVEGSPVYGNVEPMNLKKMRELGLRALHLCEYESEHLVSDSKYEQWKILSGDKQTEDTFEEWLKKSKHA